MKRFNANEKFDMVQNYYTSGVSIQEYSDSVGIAKSTLYKWLELYRSSTEQENMFVPVLNDVVTEISKPKKLDLIIDDIQNKDDHNLNDIVLKMNDITLNFDISILSKVLMVLK